MALFLLALRHALSNFLLETLVLHQKDWPVMLSVSTSLRLGHFLQNFPEDDLVSGTGTCCRISLYSGGVVSSLGQPATVVNVSPGLLVQVAFGLLTGTDCSCRLTSPPHRAAKASVDGPHSAWSLDLPPTYPQGE